MKAKLLVPHLGRVRELVSYLESLAKAVATSGTGKSCQWRLGNAILSCFRLPAVIGYLFIYLFTSQACMWNRSSFKTGFLLVLIFYNGENKIIGVSVN